MLIATWLFPRSWVIAKQNYDVELSSRMGTWGEDEDAVGEEMEGKVMKEKEEMEELVVSYGGDYSEMS